MGEDYGKESREAEVARANEAIETAIFWGAVIAVVVVVIAIN